MKRCFNTQEAMDYLGVRRRFFVERIAPTLEDKKVRAGTSIVYEKADLDEAWDRYKLAAGSERTSSEGIEKWDVRNRPGSTRKKAATPLMPGAAGSEFAAVVSSITRKHTGT